MTLLQPASPAQGTPIELMLGSAAGHRDDFFVLGYSHEYDRFESARHPEHEQNTFMLHYRQLARHLVRILPQRLNDIWQSPLRKTYAVGEPEGVLQVDADGVTEISLPDVPGTSASIWGPDEANIFTCGHYRPFWFYRRDGVWQRLPLPADVSGLWRVAGHHERDAYAVSDSGEILHFDGQRVTRLDSPTTRWLVAAAPMPDRLMCVGGHDGTLLYGSTIGWRTIATGTEQPIFNLVSFRDGVCYVTPEGLWLFDGRQAPVRLTEQGGRWVSRVGDSLIVVNNERSYLYDGSSLVLLDTVI